MSNSNNAYKPITNLNILLHISPTTNTYYNQLLEQLNILRSMKHINLLAIINSLNDGNINHQNTSGTTLFDNITNDNAVQPLLREHIHDTPIDYTINYFNDFTNTVLIAKSDYVEEIITNLKENTKTTTKNVDNMAIIEYKDIMSLIRLLFGLQTCFRKYSALNSITDKNYPEYYKSLYTDEVILACELPYRKVDNSNKQETKNKYQHVITLINNIMNNSYKPKNIKSIPLTIALSNNNDKLPKSGGKRIGIFKKLGMAVKRKFTRKNVESGTNSEREPLLRTSQLSTTSRTPTPPPRTPTPPPRDRVTRKSISRNDDPHDEPESQLVSGEPFTNMQTMDQPPPRTPTPPPRTPTQPPRKPTQPPTSEVSRNYVNGKYMNNFNSNSKFKILVKENKPYARYDKYNIIFKYNNLSGLTIIDFILFTDIGKPSKDTIKRYTTLNKKYKYKLRGVLYNKDKKTKRTAKIVDKFNKAKTKYTKKFNRRLTSALTQS